MKIQTRRGAVRISRISHQGLRSDGGRASGAELKSSGCGNCIVHALTWLSYEDKVGLGVTYGSVK